MALRVLSDQPNSTCDQGEVMISAYCAGEGTLKIEGTAGASCESQANTPVVVVCAKR
jgi:hypothetical protein